MINQRTHIDYQPHSRPKRYYIIESQLRSGVRGTTYTDNYRPLKVSRFTLLQKQLMALFIVAACAFLLAFEVGLISWMAELFN